MKECAFRMAKAQWAVGSADAGLAQTIIQKVKRPSTTVQIGVENVAGVHLPVFLLRKDSGYEGKMY
jgi:V-type H+-transporting ATPase subunit D